MFKNENINGFRPLAGNKSHKFLAMQEMSNPKKNSFRPLAGNKSHKYDT